MKSLSLAETPPGSVVCVRELPADLAHHTGWLASGLLPGAVVVVHRCTSQHLYVTFHDHPLVLKRELALHIVVDVLEEMVTT